MKIVCPACEAAYEVPEVVLTSRRKMRCARCAHDWVPSAAKAAAAAAPAPVPPPPAVAPSPAEVPAMAAAPPEPDAAPAHAEEVAPAHVHAPVVEAEAVADNEPEDEPDTEPPQDLRQYLVVRPDTPVMMFPDEIVAPRPSPIPPKVLVVPPAAQGQPWLAWGVSIGLLAVLIAAAVLFRGPVMKIWPPSIRVYIALGLSQ
jgi:predicted Zn finger-like uncharacterized protein